MPNITDNLKFIYNLHLKISRLSKGKPYRFREDFNNFETEENYSKWIILEHFFNRFPNLDKEMYFKAPYMLWKDKEYFPIDFYITPAATRAYTTYKNQLQQQDPDNDEALEYIKQSLLFIAKYCKENNIKLKEYILDCSGAIYTWMKHIRQGQISPYIIFGFNETDDIIYNTPDDEKDLLLGEFGKNMYYYKEKYNKSKYAKQLITIGLKKLKSVEKI